MLASEPTVWTAAQVGRILRPFGADDSALAVLEGVVEGWKTREWDAKVSPLGRQLQELNMNLYRTEPAVGADPGERPSFGVDREKQAKIPPMRRQVLDAAFAAAAVLFGEVAAALGLAPDSAEMLALRLERVQMATDFAGNMGGGLAYVTSPSAILSRARVAPEAARAFLEHSREDWKAFADGLLAEVLAVVARDTSVLGNDNAVGRIAGSISGAGQGLSFAGAAGILVETVAAIDGADGTTLVAKTDGISAPGMAELVARAGDITRAAIASSLAGEIYGLKSLRKDLEDAEHNTTRFVILSKKPTRADPRKGPAVTTFVFRVKNRPAALYKAMGGFATNGVNMTKLESYMMGGKFTATQFYSDVEGHPDEPGLGHALEELGFFSDMVKIIGVYPAHPYRFKGRH